MPQTSPMSWLYLSVAMMMVLMSNSTTMESMESEKKKDKEKMTNKMSKWMW